MPRRTPTFSRGDASSPVSQLPPWIVTELGAGKLGIECPRKNCHGKAVVNGKKWRNSMPQIGRSCTYCFKTNRVPS